MFKFDHQDPRNYFAMGFAAVVLCLAVPIVPNWRTFIHMWQAEFVASIFLIWALCYLIYKRRSNQIFLALDRTELKFIVFPIAAFILWSALSISWAPSWRSALHHTLVWTEYLVFYLLVRSVIASNKGYRKLLLVLTGSFVLVSLPAIVEYASLLIFGGGTSLGLRYARYGEQINTLVPLVVVAVVSLRGKRFAAGVAALALIWLLVFASLGRTNIALFALAIGLIGSCVFLFKRFHQFRLRVVIIVLALIAAPAPLHLFSLFSADPNIPVMRRVNDDAGIGSSNGFRKLMAAISLEMFKQASITGIGADNFGMQLNNYRIAYGSKNPTDPNLVNAENEIPERSHNEYLQILAELGIVGAALFAWLLGGIAILIFRALRNRSSLTAFAGITGIAVFLASSLVTSYSFRLIQNGFIFFFVLAVAAKLLYRGQVGETVTIKKEKLVPVCALGIAACALLLGYGSLRVASVIYAARAEAIQDLDAAIPAYQKAIGLDSENPDVEFSYGFRLMDAKRYEQASVHLERSIAIGRGPSVSYSFLATAYLAGGDPQAAQRSFSNAVKLYPLSSFARSRYAFLLLKAGENEKAAEEMRRAREISEADSATWATLMTEGARKASENANRDQLLSPIMDLTPTPAIYAILFERIIEHPDEKSTLDFMK